MKKLIVLLILCAVTVSGAEKLYILQLGAFDLKNGTNAQKEADILLYKAQKAGLEVVQRKKRKNGHIYIVIQSKRYQNRSQLQNMIHKAEGENLDYFYYVSGNRQISEKKSVDFRSRKKEERELPFFGKNDTFVHLLEDGLHIQEDLQKSKEAYLKFYEETFYRTALEVKIGGEYAIGQERNGFDTGLTWKLFDNGYIGSRKDAKKKRLQKSIAYSRDMQTLLSNYSKIAEYEIDDIKKSIMYYYTQQKQRLLKKMFLLSGKRLHQGLITQSNFDKIKISYQKNMKDLHYLSRYNNKKFDSRYQKLISSIEITKLLDIDTIKNITFKNTPSMQLEEQKLKLANMHDTWHDRIKGELYIDRKQYTFIDRRETLTGFQLNIPLDTFDYKDELKTVERQNLKRKQKSLKLLLGKQIESFYEDITYHKDLIAKIKEEICFLTDKKREISQKKRNPLPTDKKDFTMQKIFTEVKIIELEHNIWLERCNILSKLLKLQYLSGIKIL